MGMERLVEVTLEIDAELKEQAEKVFAENGLWKKQRFYFLRKPFVWGGSHLSLMMI